MVHKQKHTWFSYITWKFAFKNKIWRKQKQKFITSCVRKKSDFWTASRNLFKRCKILKAVVDACSPKNFSNISPTFSCLFTFAKFLCRIPPGIWKTMNFWKQGWKLQQIFQKLVRRFNSSAKTNFSSFNPITQCWGRAFPFPKLHVPRFRYSFSCVFFLSRLVRIQCGHFFIQIVSQSFTIKLRLQKSSETA